MNDKKLNRLITITKALFINRKDLRTFHTTFVLKKNKIISIGINSNKTHPETEKCDYNHEVTLHSELDAILKLNKISKSNHYTFVNVRLKKDKTVANSKPCKGCQNLLSRINYKNFFYSTENGKFEKFNP